jgi:hypothetical protein
VVNAQGHILFYRRDTGSVLICTGAQRKSGHLSPFWSHILDCGLRSTGEQIGVLFYNAVTGLYAVVDMDATGNPITRVSPRWQYSFMRAGWTHVVKAQEGLFFYDSSSGDAMAGYLLTAQEDEIQRLQPFQVLPDSVGFVSSLRPYRKVSSGMAFTGF